MYSKKYQPILLKRRTVLFPVVGTVFDSSAILWFSNMDGLVMRIDSTGEPTWIKRYGKWTAPELFRG